MHMACPFERPAFWEEAALARVGGDRTLLRAMVAVFARQWQTLVSEIVQAVGRGDGAELELRAHRLRLSLTSFGADQASRVARTLEALGRNGKAHDSERFCTELAAQVDRLVRDLKEI
jgi:HPt (histidine-containing phosphotransfer) domain-containing protein